MSDLTFTTQSSFLHHGIQGQKWGVQNGPPYPLDRKAARAERKTARKEAKTQRKIERINRKAAEYAAKTKVKNEKTSYKRAKNELEKQKATYRDLKRDKWTKDIYTGETQKEILKRKQSEREYQLRAQNQNYQQKQGTLKNSLKKTLIDAGTTLLKDAVIEIGKDAIKNKVIDPYKDSHMTTSQREKKERDKYLEDLRYQKDIRAAQNVINAPKNWEDKK